MVDSRLSQRTITPGKKKETPNLSLGRTPAAFSFLKRCLNSYILTEPWGISSAGRARPSQGRGRRFDPAMLHQIEWRSNFRSSDLSDQWMLRLTVRRTRYSQAITNIGEQPMLTFFRTIFLKFWLPREVLSEEVFFLFLSFPFLGRF